MTSHFAKYTGPVLSEDYVVPEIVENSMSRHEASAILHTELTEILKDHGYEISHYEIFKFLPGHALSIHTDGAKISEVGKIIVVLGEDGLKLEWFSTNTDTKPKLATTSMRTAFLKFDETEVTLEEEAILSGAYLINSGVPHRPTNLNKPCVCLAFLVKAQPDIDDSCLSFGKLKELLNV